PCPRPSSSSWRRPRRGGAWPRGCTTSAGRSSCATHTTPQAPAYITDGGPPRISVAALVQLAQWCQARRSELTGESPGPAAVDPPSPPAPKAPATSPAAEPTLGGPARRAASGGPAGAQPDHPPEPPAQRGEGGQP